MFFGYHIVTVSQANSICLVSGYTEQKHRWMTMVLDLHISLSQLEIYLTTYWFKKHFILFEWKDYCNSLLTSLPASTLVLYTLFSTQQPENPVKNVSQISHSLLKMSSPYLSKSLSFSNSTRDPNTQSPYPSAQLILLSPCSSGTS